MDFTAANVNSYIWNTHATLRV